MASAAMGATGPVDVPSGGKALRASETRQIQYALGGGFTRHRTINGSTTTSQYARKAKTAGGLTCTVVISGIGRVVKSAPDAGGKIRYEAGTFDATETGFSNGLHWATGTGGLGLGGPVIATAWRRTRPSDGLASAKGWLAFDVVARDANNSGETCRSFVLRERARIARAVLSFHVIAR